MDGAAPLNAATSGTNKGKLVTGADGTFTAEAKAKTLGEIANVSAQKDGWTFVPSAYPAAAHPGAETPSITFSGFVNATIMGRVAAPGGGPISGVVVSATPAAGGDVAATDTTGVTGSFSLSVSGVGGSYNLRALLDLPPRRRSTIFPVARCCAINRVSWARENPVLSWRSSLIVDFSFLRRPW